ncbi:MAG TPA: hypothetical protein EYM83_05520 [Nitrospirales bacterium]|nr:hypothetical protein [Nitrospirales bacterium]
MKCTRNSFAIVILNGLLLLGFASMASAENEQEMSIEERIKALERVSEEFVAHEEEEQHLKEQREREADAASSGYSGSGSLIYARPGYSRSRAVIGGYIDLEYTNLAGPTNAIRNSNSTFDQHRFVPFIYADVTERTRVAAELEIEHGGDDIDIEFAVIDHAFAEWFNLRAGVVLLPVGKFNLIHDSPINDLTARPEVNLRVIPGVLREPGIGFYGTVFPTKLSKLDYEFYVTTGMNGFSEDDTSRITNAAGLRDSRWNKTDIGSNFDNNNGKALSGRVAFSPILGLELGVSGYRATIDPASDRSLTISALDWTLQRGPWELLGELAYTNIEDNNRDLAGQFTGNPERMSGYYVQANYHFMPQAVKRMAPRYFRDDATFTGVLRIDDVNTNLDASGGAGDIFRITPGLNFRPTEDTVFKFEYQFNFEPNRIASREMNNNGVLLSIATYF